MSKPFNIHDWQAKQRHLTEERSQESMNNADIRALQTVVGEYSLNKVLNTIAFIADRIGKHDEADMVKKLASQIQDFEPMDMDEASMTNFGPVRSATKYNGLPIRDNVMDYSNEILNQINDYENNVGPGEQMIDYNATRKAARDLMDAVDRDEEGMMEANTTGTGASFNAGSGEGYMTPKAFKKKRKDD